MYLERSLVEYWQMPLGLLLPYLLLLELRQWPDLLQINVCAVLQKHFGKVTIVYPLTKIFLTII
jgi:hypothetical protein